MVLIDGPPCLDTRLWIGCSIEPGLLKSIAEASGGNYAFISDQSMLGAVMIHVVANLQSTFATSAKLAITDSKGVKLAQTVTITLKSQRQPLTRKSFYCRHRRSIQEGGHRTDTNGQPLSPDGRTTYGNSAGIELEKQTSYNMAHTLATSNRTTIQRPDEDQSYGSVPALLRDSRPKPMAMLNWSSRRSSEVPCGWYMQSIKPPFLLAVTTGTLHAIVSQEDNARATARWFRPKKRTREVC
ncbi:hypothetical protein K432DRAFT_396184 [Lepidopterella palustris CBS 459.81]|uniref:Uncharacterized protein n=1 Tax=Lepidopterella palustris CBS 459.81 TaxID=1314670 RepID=A0A8E2JBT1_9PEZI|nr:hypothetical protein K432DRAFT_396184 [Lepidopterella palustris CBS 459.81]